jgi:hypothetical protein
MRVARSIVSGILLGSVFGLPGNVRAQPRPQALENAQRYRERLQTGMVEFSLRDTRWGLPTTFYTAQFGKADDILVNRGDEHGLFFCSDGSVSTAHVGAHAVLKKDDRTWVHDSDYIAADVYESGSRAENIFRLRALGLAWRFSLDDAHETLWRERVKQPGARTYHESVQDGLHVVTCEADYGTITWWIDPERGWNPVRVTLEDGRGVIAESRSTLRQFDGVWYPATTVFHKGGKLVQVVSVESARFNRPEDPRVLTPGDIGIECGMQLSVQRSGDQTQIMMYDGEKPVSLHEYAKRFHAGEVQRGPRSQRALARLEAEAVEREFGHVGSPEDPKYDGMVKGRRATEWEEYTRRFIVKYRLDSEQEQKALAILRDCQERANQYILQHRAEFEGLIRRARAVAENANDSERSGAYSAVYQTRTRLTRPIVRIFDEQLKPRLEKLPTRAQREAADGGSPPTEPKKKERATRP